MSKQWFCEFCHRASSHPPSHLCSLVVLKEELSKKDSEIRELKELARDLFKRCAWYRHRLDVYSNPPTDEALDKEFKNLIKNATKILGE